MPIVNSEIGKYCNIWHEDLVNIYDSIIGENTKIGAFVEIGKARIGANCKIGCQAYICPGTIIEDSVFVAHGVRFCNIKTPRAEVNRSGELKGAMVGRGASIGAGSIIMPGVTIGEYALVGAGSVVTRDVPANCLAYGNPARLRGDVDANGNVVERCLIGSTSGG